MVRWWAVQSEQTDCMVWKSDGWSGGGWYKQKSWIDCMVWKSEGQVVGGTSRTAWCGRVMVRWWVVQAEDTDCMLWKSDGQCASSNECAAVRHLT